MQKKNYKKQTQLIRGGVTLSQHGETSEALFFNSGYQAVIKISKKKYTPRTKLSSI